MLSDKNSGDIISKIYLERKNIYNLADFKINCDDQNKVQIVKKIYAIYEDEKDKH